MYGSEERQLLTPEGAAGKREGSGRRRIEMLKTYRIYGKRLQEWTREDEQGRVRLVQVEIEYKEYDEEGDLVGAGSEDFSLERLHKTLAQNKLVYTWDGQKRNKGGHRWFDFQGYITFNKKQSKLIKDHLMRRYGAELVQLR